MLSSNSSSGALKGKAGEESAEKTAVRLPTLDEMKKRQEDILVKKNAYKYKQQETAEMETYSPAQIAQFVASARREADTIVQNAKREAKEVADQIMDDAYASRDQVFQEARDEAYQESQRVALDELTEANRILDDMYKDAVSRYKAQAEAFFEQLKAYMLDTALTIAQLIMKTEFDRNDEAFYNMVCSVLTDVTTKHPVILRVSPWEYQRFFKEPGTLSKALEADMLNIEVYEDKNLAQSEFKLAIDAETISGGIQTQLARLGFALDYRKIE